MEATTPHKEAATTHMDAATTHTATITAHTAPGTIKPPFEPTTTVHEKWRSHFWTAISAAVNRNVGNREKCFGVLENCFDSPHNFFLTFLTGEKQKPGKFFFLFFSVFVFSYSLFSIIILVFRLVSLSWLPVLVPCLGSLPWFPVLILWLGAPSWFPGLVPCLLCLQLLHVVSNGVEP